jgi:hypothetical protein
LSSIKLSPNASGTGAFTIAAPNSNTDRTLTLPDNTGTILTTGSASVLPKGNPAFRATTSPSQTISNATNTKLAANVETFDTASCYNNTGSTVGGIPSYSFLPNVAGYYQVLGNMQYSGPAYTGLLLIQVWKNNVNYEELTVIGSPVEFSRVLGSSLVYLNGSTDYIHLNGYQAQGSSRPVETIFSAFLVRAD